LTAGDPNLLLAQAYSRARHALKGVLATEGFLEDALAAALGCSDVWGRLVRHLGWNGRVPESAPSEVKTQTPTADDAGRTDIRLEWRDHVSVVLELKAGPAPSENQLRTYLEDKAADGCLVGAIAKYPSLLNLPRYESRVLGVKTWRRIRELDWDGSPLVWKQLQRLIDETEVAVPRITIGPLVGVCASWEAFGVLKDWASAGAETVRRVLEAGGLKCARGKRIADTYQRYAYWLWTPPWRSDQFSFFSGLFIGRPPSDPVCVDGVPDLVIALHVKPGSPMSDAILGGDVDLNNRLAQWASGQSSRRREFRTTPGTWEVVRVRASAIDLLKADDQGSALATWMKTSAEEWRSAGIVARLAELEVATRAATGSAPAPDEDGGP
jgi:hypothetical protein